MKAKTIFRKAAVIILSAILFTACSKTGPAGPQGEQGPKGDKGDQGATGAKGATGTANVIYSDWITINISQWTGFGKSSTITSNISVPKLTAAIRDNGVVLVYYLFAGHVHLLPYIEPTEGSVTNFTYVAGTITLSFSLLSGAVIGGFSTETQFRYVLIPGGIHARTASPPPALKNYHAVCQYYGIPE